MPAPPYCFEFSSLIFCCWHICNPFFLVKVVWIIRLFLFCFFNSIAEEKYFWGKWFVVPNETFCLTLKQTLCFWTCFALPKIQWIFFLMDMKMFCFRNKMFLTCQKVLLIFLHVSNWPEFHISFLALEQQFLSELILCSNSFPCTSNSWPTHFLQSLLLICFAYSIAFFTASPYKELLLTTHGPSFYFL